MAILKSISAALVTKINDMENGKVYWSNWAGISDVTSSMQVQRGLGASKIAIASVGGTINIVTRASDMQEGGTVSASLGNNGFYKVMGAYNTGKSKKGWSSSVLLSRTAGATYVNSTDFESYNYFFALGYTPNEKHSFQFMFTGAPQWHHQRSTHITIADYLKYGEDGPIFATIQTGVTTKEVNLTSVEMYITSR